MMSFDESGYILYPRASQTQQVPAYDFQVSIPGWHSSVLNLLLSLRAARSNSLTQIDTVGSGAHPACPRQ
jgi:hypothetical protein